jgi:hypothetical protein
MIYVQRDKQVSLRFLKRLWKAFERSEKDFETPFKGLQKPFQTPSNALNRSLKAFDMSLKGLLNVFLRSLKALKIHLNMFFKGP